MSFVGSPNDPGYASSGGAATQGLLAARPVNPTAGQLYFATDTLELFIGNAAGNAWQSIGQTSAGTLGILGGGFANTLQIKPGGTNRGQLGCTINDANSIGISAVAELVLQTGLGGPVNNQVKGASHVTVVSADLNVATVGKGIQVAEGANAKQGVATLAAGTVTVANTSVTANSRILCFPQETGILKGTLRVTARVAGTSFTIESHDNTDTKIATDTVQFAYEIYEPA